MYIPKGKEKIGMNINFNVTKEKRKELVNEISKITGAKPKYMGVPTMNYEIDYFTVTKKGELIFDDRADSEEIENLLEELAKAGFVADETKEIDLEVSMPLERVAPGRLTTLLDAKEDLIKKALRVKTVGIKIEEDKVIFPWFKKVDPIEVQSYTRFIEKLCKMTKDAKRVVARKKDIKNEKYEFRCFLLRLGFIGDEYKLDRKVLLRNLEGSSAFKNGGSDEISK